MGIFRFSADKKILRDRQDNTEAFWSNFLAPVAEIPRPPHPNHLNFTRKSLHIWDVLRHSQKGKVVYVNPYFVSIFGFCIVNFWEIQSQF